MKIVDFSDGKLELKFMWVPTFIGQNVMMMKELEAAWKERYAGKEIKGDKDLEEIHKWTISWICVKFPIPGLDRYLHALRWVKEA